MDTRQLNISKERENQYYSINADIQQCYYQPIGRSEIAQYWNQELMNAPKRAREVRGNRAIQNRIF